MFSITKELSLILPCYNEEEIFETSVRKISKFLNSKNIDYELIFVEDKSQDNTANLIQRELKSNSRARAIFHKQNTGRGGAVADGIRIAKGKYVGFIDLDLEVSEKYIISFIDALKNGYDIVSHIRHSDANLGNFFRNFLHKSYLIFADFLIDLPVKDPNGGYKFFNRKKILPIIEKTIDLHWFWETELLKRASLAGLKIKEIDVVFCKNKDKKSTVKVFSDTIYFISKVFWLRKILRGEKNEF